MSLLTDPFSSLTIPTGGATLGTNSTGGANTASAASRTSSGDDALANKEVFLQLLVAQIKNQNPMNPADSIQYITQLSQFTGVEQLVDIKNQLRDLTAALAPSPDGEPEPRTGGQL
jgi:flagellar basal-body rod modification protein FlgD